MSIADEDERVQKNTFTKWINYHLEEVGCPSSSKDILSFQHSSSGRVVDLFEDIKDGVLLCHLIEVLTGEALVCPLLFSSLSGLQLTFYSLLFLFYSSLSLVTFPRCSPNPATPPLFMYIPR